MTAMNRTRGMTPASLARRACLLSLVALAAGSIATQALAAEPDAPKSGKALFRMLCASCHGTEGKGDGPVAPMLVTPPSDLTRIAARNNGRFTADTVQRFIDGRETTRAHGPRDMPVWGRQLYFSAEDDDPAARAHADAEIAKIVEYLRSIQRL